MSGLRVEGDRHNVRGQLRRERGRKRPATGPGCFRQRPGRPRPGRPSGALEHRGEPSRLPAVTPHCRSGPALRLAGAALAAGLGGLARLVQAALEGATAPPPPAPPSCPHCGLPQERYRTLYDGHWVLLEPRILVPAHTVPPHRRWVFTSDGAAMTLWDAEPLPETRCRIAHRMVCPYLPRDDPWPWTTALRQENERRGQRLFNLPAGWALPDAG
nr:DUF6083 domain-containing protein [Streptomyces sp. SID4936]